MKKFLLLSLALFIISACESPVDPAPLPVEPDGAAAVEVDDSIPEGWVEHSDEEIGVSFWGPEAEHSSKEDLAGFDTGQLKSIQVTDFTITAASTDYGIGVGEGCCYNFSGVALDLSKTDVELETEIETQLNEIYELERITVDGRPALQFIRVNSYIESSVVLTVLMPYEVNGFSNLMISGPALFMTTTLDGNVSQEQQIRDFAESDYDSDHAEKIDIFERILSTIQFI